MFSTILGCVLARGLEHPVVAMNATVRAIGERLPDNDAEVLGRLLPPELERVVQQGQYDGDFDSDELVRRVARSTRVSEETASANVAIVMHALGDVLDRAALVHMAHLLPERIACSLLGTDTVEVRISASIVATGAHACTADASPGVASGARR